MPLYLVRSPNGGLAVVSADSDMDAKLDVNCALFSIDLAELTVIELDIETTKNCVIEINSFKDGSISI